MFSGFVLGTILQEFWRGAVIRRKSTGTDLFTATIGLVGRSRRRYGGYIVHVGIVLMFLGFAGQGFKQSEQVLLKPGQQTTVGGYTVRMDALRVTQDDQKQMVTGHFTVFEGGREIAKMYPARWFFNKHEEPTTEVAIRRKFEEDLYLNMHAFQVADQTASLEIVVNPLVNWIWLGFAVMALGTGIVLLPERTFAFAMAKFPAPEVATTAGMFLLILCLGTPAFAQHTETAPLCPSRMYSPLETRAAARDHLHVRHVRAQELAECTCSQAADMRTELAGLVRERQDARRRHSVLTSPNTAARSRSRRPSIRGSTGWRGSFRTPSAALLPLQAPSWSESGRGARTKNRRLQRRPQRSAEDAELAGAARSRARKPRLVPCLPRHRRPIRCGRGSSSRSARSCARRPPSSSFAARAPRT